MTSARVICWNDQADLAHGIYALARVMRLQAFAADSGLKASAQLVLYTVAKDTAREQRHPAFVKQLMEYLMEPVDNTKPGKRSRHLKVVREEPTK